MKICTQHLNTATGILVYSNISNTALNRDNYNSLTLAKLPPKHKDGQLKSICVDKKILT